MKQGLREYASRLFRFTRKHRPGLMISMSVCVISLALYVAVYLVPHPNPALRFLSYIELRTLDTRFQLRGQRDQPQQHRDAGEGPRIRSRNAIQQRREQLRREECRNHADRNARQRHALSVTEHQLQHLARLRTQRCS